MTTQFRVLYCTDTYPPQLNGVSVVTALSVQGLRARGWDVQVVRPTYPEGTHDVFSTGEGERPVDVAIPSFPLPKYPDIRLAAPSCMAMRRVVRDFRPHLVHSATEFMLGWMGQREGRRLGTPVVSSYHTDFSRYTEAYGVPRLRARVQRYLTRFHRRSHRVFTPGSVARDELLALGVQAVELWGRGVDVELFNPMHRDRAALQIPGIDQNTFLFLHVGRLAAEKGVERILEAYARTRSLLPAGRRTHLIIAGDGPRAEVLKASAPEGVTFLGNLDRRTELPLLYASADAFLFASHTETLGLVILEAMASGLPVIAAPAGGVADHLTNNFNGLSYPPGRTEEMADAMLRLMNSYDLLLRLAAGARQTARELSWDRELDRLAESYREVISTASHDR